MVCYYYLFHLILWNTVKKFVYFFSGVFYKWLRIQKCAVSLAKQITMHVRAKLENKIPIYDSEK